MVKGMFGKITARVCSMKELKDLGNRCLGGWGESSAAAVDDYCIVTDIGSTKGDVTTCAVQEYTDIHTRYVNDKAMEQ